MELFSRCWKGPAPGQTLEHPRRCSRPRRSRPRCRRGRRSRSRPSAPAAAPGRAPRPLPRCAAAQGTPRGAPTARCGSSPARPNCTCRKGKASTRQRLSSWHVCTGRVCMRGARCRHTPSQWRGMSVPLQPETLAQDHSSVVLHVPRLQQARAHVAAILQASPGQAWEGRSEARAAPCSAMGGAGWLQARQPGCIAGPPCGAAPARPAGRRAAAGRAAALHRGCRRRRSCCCCHCCCCCRRRRQSSAAGPPRRAGTPAARPRW